MAHGFLIGTPSFSTMPTMHPSNVSHELMFSTNFLNSVKLPIDAMGWPLNGNLRIQMTDKIDKIQPLMTISFQKHVGDIQL